MLNIPIEVDISISVMRKAKKHEKARYFDTPIFRKKTITYILFEIFLISNNICI